MSNKIKIYYPNLFVTNLLIQSFFENICIYKLKFFSFRTKNEKEIQYKFKSILQEENESTVNVLYLIFSKIEKIISFYNTLNDEYEEDKEQKNNLFLYTLSNLSILYITLIKERFELTEILEKHLPITHNFLDKYFVFIENLVNLIDNSTIKQTDDFTNIDSYIFQEINKKFKNLKDKFKTDIILSELENITNIYDLFYKKYNLENKLFYEYDYKIKFLSHYPDFIFIDNVFLNENISTNILLNKLNNKSLILMNKFLLSMFYLITLEEDKKNSFIARALKNKIIKNNSFSLNEDFEIIEDNNIFLNKFISRFNIKKTNSNFVKTKIHSFIKEKPNNYKKLEEIELFFINLIEKTKNLILYEKGAKNIKNFSYEDEVKNLSQIFLTFLKKENQDE